MSTTNTTALVLALPLLPPRLPLVLLLPLLLPGAIMEYVGHVAFIAGTGKEPLDLSNQRRVQCARSGPVRLWAESEEPRVKINISKISLEHWSDCGSPVQSSLQPTVGLSQAIVAHRLV